MWKRKELKTQAKSALKANYWRSVLVAVIMTILVSGSAAGIRSGALSGGISGATMGSRLFSDRYDTFYDYTDDAKSKAVDETAGAADETAEAVDETAGAIDTDGVSGATKIANEYAYDARTDINASVEDILKLAGVSNEQLTELGGLDKNASLVIIMIIFALLMGIFLIVFVISFIVNIFVINPFKIGCHAFFMENTRTDNMNISALERGFTPKYVRNVGAMLLKSVYIFFWTMLFVIPGAIKTYSYRMVPYILADDPEIGANDAITRSREMMKGNKWRVFVLDLSFIGWFILSMLTCGLVGIFYVNPYVYGTEAALYNALKGEVHEVSEAPAED